MTGLRDYFAHVPAPDAASRPDLELIAIESAPPEPPDWDFVDWKREPGKTGRKDAYLDLPDGRLARYYELGANRPLYVQRRGKVYSLTYDDSALSAGFTAFCHRVR